MAIAISTVLVISILALCRTATASSLGLERAARTFERIDEAMQTLERDIACAVPLPLAGTTPFVLRPGSAGSDTFSEIQFHAASGTMRDSSLKALEIHRVRYYTREHSRATGMLELVRETAEIRADGSAAEPEEEVFRCRFTSFKLALYDGEKWHSEWPAGHVSSTMPTAARLSVWWKEGRRTKTIDSEVFVRASMGQ